MPVSYHLTLAEQETIILWDNELDTASIYTHDARMIRRLRELSEKYPDDYVLEKEGPQHSVTYRIPKRLVTLRSPYSEERRQRDREIALAANRRVPDRKKTEQQFGKR